MATAIESATPFDITEMRVVSEGVVAVITAMTPDGQKANASLYFTADEDGEIEAAEKIVRLTRDASEALQRYCESFVPVEPPKWDEQQWGP